ncbi:hypothetical protein Taro_007218 [Colocasia esculenta]|uniref:Uncharacterized protein n=1 Tax=Colocasia esculenta TaxID=4460 RepID=A0A843TUX4_COLES|nr:hypothetical protein [Colocasia esculenta]
MLGALAAARVLIFRTGGACGRLYLDSNVVSLDGREPLQTKAEVGDDGRLRVTMRRSAGSRSEIGGAAEDGEAEKPCEGDDLDPKKVT